MPSLADRIQANRKVLTRGPGGQLVEETQESIQDLSAKAGLAAPPLTAQGAASIGATPEQTKMQGTPMQKQAALNLAAQAAPQQDLQTAIRQGQVRTEATAAEAGKIQKSKDMENLGSLGDRVTDFINAQRTKLASAEAQAQPKAAQVVTGAAGELSAEQALIAKPLLEKLAKKPGDMQLQLQVNQALGYDANRQLGPDEINNLYADATESIARSGADVVANNLTANDLIQQGGLGYDATQLSALLGVPVDQIGSMTIGQIQDQISKAMADEFSQTAELERQAQSGQLGAAERALARAGAREASMVGTRSSEADVAALEQQIASADQVQFGGQVMSVEQLLSDDTISSVISDYINAAPGSPTRLQLEQTEPALVQFIQKNEAVIADAARALSSGAQQFQQLQAQNKQAATLGGMIPDTLARDIIPGFGELSATAIDPSKVPVLAAAQNMGETQKQQYAQNLQNVARFPGASQELRDLSEQEIAQLGLDDPNGPWSGFLDQQQRFQEIMSVPDDQIDTLISKVYDVGSPPSGHSWADEVRLNAANTALGFKGARSDAAATIDADGDGQIDSASSIRDRLVTGRPSLRDAISGQQKVAEPRPYDAAVDPPDVKLDDDLLRFGTKSQREAQLQASLWKRLKNVAYNGSLMASELADAYGGKASSDDADIQALEINHLLKHAPLDAEAQNTLRGILDSRIEQVTDKLLRATDKHVNFDKVDDLIDSNDPVALRQKGPKRLEQLSAAEESLREMMSEFSNYNNKPIKAKLREIEKARTDLQKEMDDVPRKLREQQRKNAAAQEKRNKEVQQEAIGTKKKSKK